MRDHFGIDTEVDWAPRYNIAPTDSVATILQSANAPKRTYSRMRWGLIPSWAKDQRSAARMINARSETAAQLPAFGDAFRRRRCLIPADGFYEWQRQPGSKQPYCFTVAGGSLFAFAGLWDRWRDPAGASVETCTILTTRPNRLLRDIHDRMPVILAPHHYDLWLDPGFHDTKTLSDMLAPYPAEEMDRIAISSRVNSVRNDDPSVCEPAAAIAAGLFD